MYLVISNNKVVETFKTREAAEIYKTKSQLVQYTERKDAKPGDRASKFRR